MASQGVVDEVADRLAYRVVAGIYSPGEAMPSVRQVAAEFDVSVPTANAVLRRLASAGFLEARRGLGHIVRDVRLYGGIETWRYIFRFSRSLPDTAAKIFEDIIEVDVLILFQAVRAIIANPHRYDPTAVRHAVDRLELLSSGADVAVEEVLRAELHVLRLMHAATGQSVVLGITNSIGEMLSELPETAGAFYGPAGPSVHVVMWREILKHWEKGTAPTEAQLQGVESLLMDYHRQVVETFRELVSAEPADEADPLSTYR